MLLCSLSFSPSRCNVDNKVSRVAWLNRTTILFAGSEKWSLDPRVILMENTAVTEYSIKIQNVDVHDEGPYVCSILTNKKPKSTRVHLIVQGKTFPALSVIVFSHNKYQKVSNKMSVGTVLLFFFCNVDVHFYRWRIENPSRSCLDLTRLRSNQINLPSSVLGWCD